jgi:sirohydrochlorin ferrochelatase
LRKSRKPEAGSGKALILVGHGSRLKGFDEAMARVARELRRQGNFHFVHCAYLEIAHPSIPEALEALIRKGAARIFVLPYFLQMGLHAKLDVPKIVNVFKKKYSGRVKIVLCRYLGYDEKIVSVVRERIRETSRR